MQVRVGPNTTILGVGRNAPYVYSWGVGVQSQIFAQNNFFLTASARRSDVLRLERLHPEHGQHRRRLRERVGAGRRADGAEREPRRATV